MAVNGKAKDLTGQTFGYWNVLNMVESEKNGGHRRYLCRCVCGKEKTLRGSMLLNGTSISCRCMTFKGKKNVTHGMSYTGTYVSWTAMKTRCLNFMDARFPTYGGRGIRICDRWIESFSNFLEDMGERPEGMTIDRIDGNGNYEPSNCRWATPMEQTLNREETVWVDYDGERICITHLCKRFNISRCALEKRMKKGLTLDEALKTPKRKKGYLISLGDASSITKGEFLKKFNLSDTTLTRLMEGGMTMGKALSELLLRKGIICLPDEIKISLIPN